MLIRSICSITHTHWWLFCFSFTFHLRGHNSFPSRLYIVLLLTSLISSRSGKTKMKEGSFKHEPLKYSRCLSLSGSDNMEILTFHCLSNSAWGFESGPPQRRERILHFFNSSERVEKKYIYIYILSIQSVVNYRQSYQSGSAQSSYCTINHNRWPPPGWGDN